MQMDSDAVESDKIRMKFVTGGSDSRALIWSLDESKITLETELKTENYRGFVRSISWSQNILLPYELISVGCESKIVEVHKCIESKWTYETIKGLSGCVWCLDWSLTGNMLSVSCGESNVAIYSVI